MTQPEALRLADALGLNYAHLTAVPEINRQAAAELRRLHAENETLADGCAAKADRIDRLGETVQRLNAEKAKLLEALKDAASCVQNNYLPDKCGHDWDDVIAKAEGQA